FLPLPCLWTYTKTSRDEIRVMLRLAVVSSTQTKNQYRFKPFLYFAVLHLNTLFIPFSSSAKIMFRYMRFIFTLFLILPEMLFGQNILSGKIVDKTTKSSLPGAY